MNLISQLTEYKEKVEALAAKAALSDSLAIKASKEEEKNNELSKQIQEKEDELEALKKRLEELEEEKEEIKKSLVSAEEEKQEANAKALEIVASLGLKNIPVITVTETEKPTAESIRAKYLAISDSAEKGKYFAENREAILNGHI